MIDYITSKQLYNYKIMENSENRNQNRLPLLGKAVLLIGNDTALLQNLVMHLAQKGADVAVLCWKIPLETARWLRDQVQSLGRRLFLMEQAKNQDSPVDQLIHRITAEWGHFDVFIDVSARQSQSVPTSNGRTRDEPQKQRELETRSDPIWRPEQWRLTQVVLEEMVRN